MRAISFLSVLLLFLASCTTQPKPEFATDIHVIDSEQLSQYWIPEKGTIEFGFNSKNKFPDSCGFVILEFLIDSNGDVFSPKIKEAEPEGAWELPALKELSLSKYLPAKANPSRTPVKVTRRTEFNPTGGEC